MTERFDHGSLFSCMITPICLHFRKDLIPGATFIGVGFDGRGDYSPESSRMDLVQRACARKQRYVS